MYVSLWIFTAIIKDCKVSKIYFSHLPEQHKKLSLIIYRKQDLSPFFFYVEPLCYMCCNIQTCTNHESDISFCWCMLSWVYVLLFQSTPFCVYLYTIVLMNHNVYFGILRSLNDVCARWIVWHFFYQYHCVLCDWDTEHLSSVNVQVCLSTIITVSSINCRASLDTCG